MIARREKCTIEVATMMMIMEKDFARVITSGD